MTYTTVSKCVPECSFEIYIYIYYIYNILCTISFYISQSERYNFFIGKQASLFCFEDGCERLSDFGG